MGKRIAIVVAVLALVPGVAAAHWVYEEGYVWAHDDGSGRCLKARSEISDGDVDADGRIKGYTKVDLRAVERGMGIDCYFDWDQEPRYLRARMTLSICLDGAYCDRDGSWDLCRVTPWARNDERTASHKTEQYWDVDCDTGYYANLGAAYVLYENRWRGGVLFSGGHHLADVCEISFVSCIPEER